MIYVIVWLKKPSMQHKKGRLIRQRTILYSLLVSRKIFFEYHFIYRTKNLCSELRISKIVSKGQNTFSITVFQILWIKKNIHWSVLVVLQFRLKRLVEKCHKHNSAPSLDSVDKKGKKTTNMTLSQTCGLVCEIVTVRYKTKHKQYEKSVE